MTQTQTKTFAIDSDNAEQQLAFDLVKSTNKCLFITGKAGTGKTTFIRRIQKEIDKNFLVLAPTGIAAINAGGQTVHSFFGFPMEVIGPHSEIHVSDFNIALLQKTDSIILDEASMLRSDMVDGMDRYLRIAFHNNMPFGGKQIIFVGDLFQLPPVIVKGSVDDEMLCDLYGPGTPFFYKASVLKRMNLPKIEFQKVYRQGDEVFVNILNKMRTGEIGENELEILNSRVASSADIDDYSVILSPFNKVVDSINNKRLDSIPGDEMEYIGTKEGTIKAADCPAPEHLKLKIGAQVIFCRNMFQSNCANGTIAKIVEMDDDEIHVQLENGRKVRVERTSWESHKRVYNRETHKIESQVIGSFTQFPLKLAWAITIHKSQGMTFDRMHLDLSRGTFLPGHIYVAISRMRSLEGLTLSKPLSKHNVCAHPEIKALANSFNDKNMIVDEIETGKETYSYIQERNFDQATICLLRHMLSKIDRHDYRNAALLGKQMYDIMLDDTCLKGLTDNVSVIPDCNMTCNFLNAIICLYGSRYEEAVGYTDLVLARRTCLEALFIKARALFELERYDEADAVNYQIFTLSNEGEEKRAIDKRLLLFSAKLNEKTGNQNLEVCKKLIKLVPECIYAYYLIRSEMQSCHRSLVPDSEDNENEIIACFDNKSVSDEDFLNLMKSKDYTSTDFKEFKKLILKLG